MRNAQIFPVSNENEYERRTLCNGISGEKFVLSKQRYNFNWRRCVQERGKTGGDGEIRVADHPTDKSGRLRVHQV